MSLAVWSYYYVLLLLGSATLGILSDRALSPSSATRAVLCSVAADLQGEQELKETEVTSFQPWSSWKSLFPIQICTDSAFASASWVFRLLCPQGFGENPVNFFLNTSGPVKSVCLLLQLFSLATQLFIHEHLLHRRSPPYPSTSERPQAPLKPQVCEAVSSVGRSFIVSSIQGQLYCCCSSSCWNCALWHVSTTTQPICVALSKAPGSLLQELPPLLAAFPGNCVLSQQFCKPPLMACWKGA